MRGLSVVVIMPAILLLIVACGPKYVTKTDYFPPGGEAGLACVSNCQNLQQSCQQDCQSSRKLCQDEAWSDAQLTLPTALEIYAVELQHYDRQSAIYHRNLKAYSRLKTDLLQDKSRAQARCESRNLLRCDRAEDIDDMLDDLKREYYGGAYNKDAPLYAKPDKPSKPTLQSEADMLMSQRCQQACSCEEGFKQCYRQCGGSIETRKVCVSNCKK